jgi:hypothetical protein
MTGDHRIDEPDEFFLKGIVLDGYQSSILHVKRSSWSGF